MGDHASQPLVLRNRAFEEYVHENHRSWYDFATSLGHALEPEDLILVFGWMKTSEWALAACTNYGRMHEISFDSQIGSMASAQFGVTLSHDVDMSVDQRCGPLSKSRGTSSAAECLPHDQCLFLRYYKLKRRLFRGVKVVAAAKPHDSSSDFESESANDGLGLSSGLVGSEGSSSEYAVEEEFPEKIAVSLSRSSSIVMSSLTTEQDPLNALLDYILAVSLSPLTRLVTLTIQIRILGRQWPLLVMKTCSTYVNQVRLLDHREARTKSI